MKNVNAPTASLLNNNENGGFLTVHFDGKSQTIRSENPRFGKAVKAYMKKKWDKLKDLMTPANAVKRHVINYENIKVEDGVVTYMDEPVANTVVDRILAFVEKGIDALPLVKFLEKLMLNPSRTSVEELYSFLDHKNLPITENGNFLAYKSLNADYTDIHSGKFDNSIGNVIEMPRNKVDDNRRNHCSYGFHAGTLEYAQGFGSGKNIVLVEINPADVVSVPEDYGCSKLRTCKYKVVEQCTSALTEPLYASRFEDTEEDTDEDN